MCYCRVTGVTAEAVTVAEATEEATVGRCICAGFSPIFLCGVAGSLLRDMHLSAGVNTLSLVVRLTLAFRSSTLSAMLRAAAAATEEAMADSRATAAATTSSSRAATVAVTAVATASKTKAMPLVTTNSRVTARAKLQPPLASLPRLHLPATTKERRPSRVTARRLDTASRATASSRCSIHSDKWFQVLSDIVALPSVLPTQSRLLSKSATQTLSPDFHTYGVYHYFLSALCVPKPQGYGATGGQAAATGYGASYGGTEAAGSSYGTAGTAAATGYGTAAVADQGGYGAYRGAATAQGRQERSYRPY